MTTGIQGRMTSAEELSALADGELDGECVARACAQWRSDPEARATWHAYQLIGDVLRSEDLASQSGRDAAFLMGLRGRLAAEPVVLAPHGATSPVAAATRPAVSSERRKWGWATSSAIAAGFVVVAGVLVVTREPAPVVAPASAVAQAGPALAAPTPGDPPVGMAQQVVAGANDPTSPRPEVSTVLANGQLIRDAGLDRYLAAHKNFSGTAALSVPSAYLRGASLDNPGR
jgi:sigma-E factor negative regulatory protein RseA